GGRTLVPNSNRASPPVNPRDPPMSLKRKPLPVLLVVLLVPIVGPRRVGGAELPAESTVQPVEVVRTGDYTEGVVVDRQGNLYFSHAKIVTKVTPDGKASTWAETGEPN